MSGWFGSRIAISTVTCIALISSAGIVDPGTADEGCSGMAIKAIQSGCKVSRIGLCIFTDCSITIMAGVTTVYDTGMIEYSSDESTGVMAEATILNGCNMSGLFAGGETCTMTRRAVIHDTYMIKRCR